MRRRGSVNSEDSATWHRTLENIISINEETKKISALTRGGEEETHPVNRRLMRRIHSAGLCLSDSGTGRRYCRNSCI